MQKGQRSSFWLVAKYFCLHHFLVEFAVKQEQTRDQLLGLGWRAELFKCMFSDFSGSLLHHAAASTLLVLLLSRWIKWEVAGMWLLQSLHPAEVNCRLNSSGFLFPLSAITTLQLQWTLTKQGYICVVRCWEVYNSGSTGICIHREVSVKHRCHSWPITTCEIGQYVFMHKELHLGLSLLWFSFWDVSVSLGGCDGRGQLS